MQQAFQGQRRLAVHNLNEFLQDGGQFRLMPFQHGIEQEPASSPKECPPEMPHVFKSLRPEGLYIEPLLLESLGSGADSRARLGRDGRYAIVLEIADAHAAQIGLLHGAEGHRRSANIAIIRTGHDLEQDLQVARSSRHRSHYSEQRERSKRGWEMAGSRDAAGRGLEPADAAEVRGNTNRAAAVAAHACHRAARGNRRRFTPPRTPRIPCMYSGVLGPL